MDTTPIRPSWWFYILAIVLFLGGISYFVYELWHGLSHITDSLVQVVVPGGAQLPLKHGVDYTVFLETESVVNGKVYSANGAVDGLSCELKFALQEAAIPLRRPNASTTYTVGGRSGRSVLEFRVPRDGSYNFACGYGIEAKGPVTVVAVGTGVDTGIWRTVVSSLLAIFGGVGSGFIVWLVTFVLRVKAKERQSSVTPVLTQPFS
jgi:hypothetical protein